MASSSAEKINPPQAQDHQPGRETEMHPKPQYEPKFKGNGRLAGKVAIITGGDSGIGRACAVLFAREGAEVAVVYLEETEDAKITAAAVKAEGREALLLRGDIGEKAFCDNVVGKTIEQFGQLDVLINNAAEQHPQEELTDISEDQLERTFRTNFYGYMFLTQASLPHLKAGASIVNTTSVTAIAAARRCWTIPRPRALSWPLPAHCRQTLLTKASALMRWRQDRFEPRLSPPRSTQKR